jgi:hypothetical protein
VDVRLAQADARSVFGGDRRIVGVQDLKNLNHARESDKCDESDEIAMRDSEAADGC